MYSRIEKVKRLERGRWMFRLAGFEELRGEFGDGVGELPSRTNEDQEVGRKRS